MRLFCCVLFLLISACQAKPPQFPLIPLTVGTLELQVQLADTVERRMRGLMEQNPVQHGMLLLYETPRDMTLWMKNTPVALDAAFIGTDWRISKIEPMAANSEALHPSPGAVIAALEMPQGWFAAQGIKVGDPVQSCRHIKVSCK